ncbi:hypothetical protein KIPB_013542, partial [Kipferlia bialata]
STLSSGTLALPLLVDTVTDLEILTLGNGPAYSTGVTPDVSQPPEARTVTVYETKYASISRAVPSAVYGEGETRWSGGVLEVRA